MVFQRARSEEQRALRRAAILDTAAAMLREMPVGELSLNELSRRVGLAKSNVLRYFESREEVLLELLDRAFFRWVAEVGAELAAGVRPELPVGERTDQLATILGRSLAAETVLCELLAAQPGVLEHNVSVEVIVHYKRRSITGVRALVEPVGRCLPELGDHAWSVCLTTLVLASVLGSHARPSASVLAAYETAPELTALRLDPAETLRATVATLITGALARTDG